MVLQVGDKVVVWGAGTESAFAKKVEPVEVGDTVDVVTLSDGTKLSMPRINLDLSDYVWVIPQWDNPAFPIDMPFSWGVLSLGAAVFTITGKSCYGVDDDYRSWEENELAGFYLIDVSLIQRIKTKSPNYYKDPEDLFALNTFIIDGNTETGYIIRRLEELLPPRDLGFAYGESVWIITRGSPVLNGSMYVYQILNTSTNIVFYHIISQRCNFSGGHTLSFKIKGICRFAVGNSTPWLEFTWKGIGKTNKFLVYFGYNFMNPSVPYIFTWNSILGYHTNPSYPDYDTFEYNLATMMPGWNPDLNHYDTTFEIEIQAGTSGSGRHYTEIELTDLSIDGCTGECTTGPLQVGDKYIVYDSTTKRLVMNDSAKLLTAANWGDTTEGSGAEVASDPVEWAWDGQGHVYLSQSKDVFSTIQYDDLLYIQAASAGQVRSIPFHLGDRITVSGQTVSREFPEITSILRAGNNTITLIAKNQDGTKVGFVTSIYVKRSMTAVSL